MDIAYKQCIHIRFIVESAGGLVSLYIILCMCCNIAFHLDFFATFNSVETSFKFLKHSLVLFLIVLSSFELLFIVFH